MKFLTGWPGAAQRKDLQNEPLIIHRQAEEKRSGTLIVFVHGLGGDRYGTWGEFPHFLLSDVPSIDVGLYAYRTLLKRFGFAASIDLDFEANLLADLLRDCSTYKKIILIGHSMGGLLCKSAIKSLIDRDDQNSLSRLKGLFLLATPQAGSGWVPPFLGGISRDLRALSSQGAFVENLHRTFVDRISASDRSPGKLFLPVFAITASEDAWVSVLSSGLNIPSCNRKVVRGSHTRIVKPSSRDNDAYRWVLDWVRYLIDQASVSDCAPQVSDKTETSAERSSGIRNGAPEITSLHTSFSERELCKTMSNPKYDEDILRLDASYNRQSVIGAETIVIVVGTSVISELLDRPVAELIRDAIDRAGGIYPYRRGVVLSDIAWYAEAGVLAMKPVIAIGGPPANKLSAEFSKWTSPPGSGEGIYTIREQGKVMGFFRLNESRLPQIGLWGKTATATRDAGDHYINSPKGLDEFLRLCWKSR